ncbi:odorant receptor 46a-like [Microplitis mediator]|uniref:odorant receptor 46a-like n=1 Tax=Microplitis mediator TaxID=375433 RepID=UPI002556EB62|nr:odorant receptor 46a-like [Microplitis mediator]
MKTLSYSFMILEYFGGWKPLEWSTSIKGKLYDIYTLTITLAMSTFCISCVIDLFYTSNIEDIVHNMSWSFTLILVCSKLALLKVKRNKLVGIIKLLDINICRVRCATEATIQLKYDEKAKNLVKKYGSLVCCAVFAIIGASILENIPTKTLPFNGWFPYQHDNSTGFWFAYFHQIITLPVTSMIGFSFDTVVYGVLLQNCSQLKILKNRLENFVEIIDEEKLNNKINGSVCTIRECEHKFIKQCIHHHWIILQFSQESNDLFAPIIFLQYLSSSLILCLCVQLLTKLAVMSPEFIFIVVYLGCMLTQIYLFCWYGNEVIIESSGVSSAIYKMNWQVLTNKTKKDLLFMKTQSILPIKFTSGYLIELSLDSFTKLIKFSYSAYNLLHQK